MALAAHTYSHIQSLMHSMHNTHPLKDYYLGIIPCVYITPTRTHTYKKIILLSAVSCAACFNFLLTCLPSPLHLHIHIGIDTLVHSCTPAHLILPSTAMMALPELHCKPASGINRCSNPLAPCAGPTRDLSATTTYTPACSAMLSTTPWVTPPVAIGMVSMACAQYALASSPEVILLPRDSVCPAVLLPVSRR